MKIKQEHESFVLQGEKWKSLRYAVYTSQGENVVRVPEKTFGKLPAIR